MSEKRQVEGDLSLLSAGTSIEGKITTEGNIRVDGRLVGDLTATANAAVGATGVVQGNVEAKNVSIAGTVHGNVVAAEKLILEEKSVMRGDIRATVLVIDEGATFDGRCAMTKQTSAGSEGSHLQK
jgi:cytoskeletal protein CcmA (bactofilin family)